MIEITADGEDRCRACSEHGDVFKVDMDRTVTWLCPSCLRELAEKAAVIVKGIKEKGFSPTVYGCPGCYNEFSEREANAADMTCPHCGCELEERGD